MKIKSILPMVASAIVGLVLTAWLLHGGAALPVEAPPENAPQNQPAPNKDGEAARREQCRKTLHDTALAFLSEAALSADGIRSRERRPKILRLIVDAQSRAGDFAAARTTAAAFIGVDNPREFATEMHEAYHAIALKQAMAGDFAEAVATVVAIMDEGADAAMLHRIMRMHLATGERGDAAAIRAWARQEEADLFRIEILLSGAKGLRIMAKSAAPSFVPPVTTPPNIPPSIPLE